MSGNFEKVFVLSFDSYDRGRTNIGVFIDEESAQKHLIFCIENDKRENPHHPLRYEQQQYRYSIEEFEIH